MQNETVESSEAVAVKLHDDQDDVVLARSAGNVAADCGSDSRLCLCACRSTWAASTDTQFGDIDRK